ncbi:uncharacterized protein [Prorops nasuta]|uniref:uncharacterized protein n=1 Tax=Prorops nasuta TaxID=863751 RepID=UPI0034CD1AF8
MWKFLMIFVLLVYIDTITSRPAEEPTKISLNSAVARPKTTPQPITRLQRGQELLGRLMDAIRFGRGRLVNSISLARNIVADQVELIASEARDNVVSAIEQAEIPDHGHGDLVIPETPPPLSKYHSYTRETVQLESEGKQGLLEKQAPKPVRGLLENFLKPTPLVDGITEKEKYGNSGDQFIGIGRALVGGFEGLSNFLNTVVDLPINAAKKTSRSLTEALNQIGARLIGLQ